MVLKKKRKKSPLKWLFLFILIFTGVMGSLFFFHTRFAFLSNKDYFVSPLPRGFNSSFSTDSISTKQLEMLLLSAKIPFSEITIASDSSYLVKLSSGEDVVFSPKKKIDLQVSSLQLILSALTIEGKGFRRLDFRFEKPVVEFK